MRRLREGLLVLGLLAWPALAGANAGVPAIALLWPLGWLLLVPITYLETLVAQQYFDLDRPTASRLVLRANIWSTLVGIPLAQGLSILLLESGVLPWRPLAPTASYLEQLLGAALVLFASSVYFAGQGPLALPLALAQVPAFFLSVAIEGFYLKRKLPAVDRARVAQWAWRANEVSYALLVGLLITVALW
jgi:hypothetical protein